MTGLAILLRVLQYFTKLLFVISMAAAIWLDVYLNAPGWSRVVPLALAGGVIAAALSIWHEGFAAACVLIFAYIFPAFVVVLGHYDDNYLVIWCAALFGVVLPRSLTAGWSFPRPWRAPLALWALTIALCWPFVALRLVDFMPAAMDLPHQTIALRSLPPRVGMIWILNVTMTLGLGILWFDWLCSTSPGLLRKWIVPSLIASGLLTISVAVYQLFGNIAFLNRGSFAALGRGSGALRDANVFGVIAALLAPIVVARVDSVSPLLRRFVVGVVLLVSWLGVWASGSRTAFAAAVIVLMFMLASLRRAVARRTRQWAVVAAGGLSLAIAFSVALQWASPSVVGPLGRLRASLPDASVRSVFSVADELLWRRNGYGSVAAAMIRDHPVFGIGVGNFQLVLSDYSDRGVLNGIPPSILPPDNAQNWYRHQLTEFGLLGSVGWIVWVLGFGALVVRAKPEESKRVSVAALKGALVALALISLVGVPTQHIAATLTFWTLAFWLLTLVQPPSVQLQEPVGARTWLGVLALAVTCAGGTWYVARHDLRIARLAMHVGYDYSYGLYQAERTPDGQQFRWTMQRAVATIPAPKPWLKLTIATNQPNLDAHPVQAKVWRDGVLVMNERLARVEPETEYIRIPEGDRRVVLDFWCDRLMRPSDYGSQDTRELGLQTWWDFVDSPPADAKIVVDQRSLYR